MKSNKDRDAIYKIISDMLNNPDKSGIYPTRTCFIRLEHYIKNARTETVGWCHAEMCISLENGTDPRNIEVPFLIERMKVGLEK